jgi:hypothetical protein
VPQNEKLPNCYAFKMSGGGDWELRAIRTGPGKKQWTFETSGDTGEPLAQGRINFATDGWHHLEFIMVGDRISLRCDGKELGSVHDSTHTRGQAGLGCDWFGVDFDNFAIKQNHL